MYIYTKGEHRLKVSNKFIYCSSVYKIWPRGAYLLKEKYYASNNPIDFKKVPMKVKKNGYYIQRFIELESAPENYLTAKGYKRIKI
jgi:hypothetical protein